MANHFPGSSYHCIGSGVRLGLSQAKPEQGVPVVQAAISLDELRIRLQEEFPQAFRVDSSLSIVAIGHGAAKLRYTFHPRSLRPGGTIAGTTMMILADAAMYVAVLASIGWVRSRSRPT